MPRTQFRGWNGIMPKVTPRNLPDMSAQTAQNCDLSHTTLEPIHAPSVISTVLAGYKSIYLWRRGTGSEWLSWLGDVNVVQGPISDDQYDRIYYTDGTTLHMNYWNGGVNTVHDVSKTAPIAPTITKGLVFDPAGIELSVVDSVTGSRDSRDLEYKGFHWNEDLLVVEFYLPAEYPFSSKPWVYHLTVPTTGMTVVKSGTAVACDQTPFDPLELIQAKMYSELLDMTKIGDTQKFATFQVVSIETTQDGTDTDSSSGINPMVTVYGLSVSVTIKMNYSRSITQYQYYVVSEVDSLGQESPCSVVSERVEWGPNDSLTITVPAHSTGTGIRRIYRSASGLTESDWFFVAEVTGITTTYADKLTDAQLSEKMPNIENPPTVMYGVVSLPGGFLAAFNGKEIYFSEPWLPYSWPTEYRQTMNYDVVGLAVSGNDLVVITKGTPVIISGSHPEMMTATMLEDEQAGVSKRGIAYADKYVLYPSPDGLVAVTGGRTNIVTQNHYTRDQWQALGPDSMIGCVHDGRYIGWMTSGAIIFDFKEQGGRLTTTDQTATGVHDDLENDELYLIQGTNITEWRGSATHLTALWKSKEYQTIRDPLFNTAIVIADSYSSLIFRIYSDGVLVHTYTVLNNNAFRIPKLARSQRWSIEIETTDVVIMCVVATSMMDIRPVSPQEPMR
jgi:hypothetical protein